jgi:hypothetical protein
MGQLHLRHFAFTEKGEKLIKCGYSFFRYYWPIVLFISEKKSIFKLFVNDTNIGMYVKI